MSSSSDNSDSSADEKVKRSSDSSDSDVETRKKRSTKSVKKTIESGGSTDSDSDADQPTSSSRKRKATKKKTTSKRRRNSSGSSHDDRIDDSLFTSAEDKARWKALSELEKEQEIFERMEARENQRTREEIAQQLKAKKEEEGKKTKKRKKVQSSDSEKSKSPVRRTKKSSESDSDNNAEFHRPSDINRKHKEKNAMADLKQKRKELEKKHAKHASLSIDAVFGAQSSGSTSSSSSSDSSRSSSRSSSRASSPAARHSEEEKVKKEVETIDELKKARLSRFKLCKIVHAPFFASAVVGCYVRVGMGFMNAAESKYKIWQVMSVEETNKIYDVDGKRTNKGLKCKHGKQERVFRIAYVSNTEFSRSEFEEWVKITKETGPFPTMDQIEKKELDIKKAVEHKFSDSEVDAMIKEKGRFQKVPRNFAMTKADLSKRKAIAQQKGDIREAEKIQLEIDELERVADNLDKKRSHDISAIAYINHRNRTSNKNEVLSGRFKMEESSQDDPFTRKKGGMKIVSGSKAKGDGTLSATSSSANLAEQDKKEAVKPSPIKEKRKSANMFDLHNSAANNIDFNIDLDKLINNGSRGVPRDEVDSTLGQGSSSFGTGDGKSRGLSLADYRRRKAQSAATTSSAN